MAAALPPAQVSPGYQYPAYLPIHLPSDVKVLLTTFRPACFFDRWTHPTPPGMSTVRTIIPKYRYSGETGIELKPENSPLVGLVVE